MFDDGVSRRQIFGAVEDTAANTVEACQASCLAKATVVPNVRDSLLDTDQYFPQGHQVFVKLSKLLQENVPSRLKR